MKRAWDEGIYLNLCSRIKTIMMILIIVYHSVALWMPEGWFNQAPAEDNIVFKYIAQWLNMIHIYVFAFVSGYIYSHSRFKLGRYSSFKDFVIKKVKRLLIPYIIISIIWCIPMYIIFYKPPIEILIKNFVLGYAPSQLWYLLMLFWLFVLIYFPSPFFYSLDSKGTLVVAFAIYAIYIVLSNYLSLPFQILTAIKFVPFFVIGMNLESYSSWSNNKMALYGYLILNIILFSVYCICPGTDLVLKIGKKTLAYFISLSGIFFVISFLKKINNRNIWLNNIYYFLEANSFILYLFHQQIIWIVIYIFNGKIPTIHLAFLNFISAIGVSSIIAWLINNCKVLHFLLGK